MPGIIQDVASVGMVMVVERNGDDEMGIEEAGGICAQILMLLNLKRE